MNFLSKYSKYLTLGVKNDNEKVQSVHSVELVITLLIFILMGRFIDTKIDSTPVFTLCFAFFGAIAGFLSAYYRYIHASKTLDKNKVWGSKKQKISAPVYEEEKTELVVPKGYGQND